MTLNAQRVAGWLRDLPALVELLPSALVVRPPGTGSAIGAGAALSHSPVPLNVAVMSLLDVRERNLALEMAWVDPDHVGVEPFLWGWVRDVACDLLDVFPDAEPEPEQTTAAASCAWLTRQLPFIAILPQWPEFAHGIERTFRAVDVATRHLRAGPMTRSIRCGACRRGRLRVAPTQRELLTLTARAYRPLRVPPVLMIAIALAPTEHGWVCGHCRRFAFVRPVTLPQAAAISGHGLRTLQRWARAGRFTRVEAAGVKLFDLSEILAAVAQARVRAALSWASDTPEDAA